MQRYILIKEACFQQACEETRLALTDRSLHCSEYPLVSGFHESMQRRVNSLTERPGEPVNFSAVLRKTLPKHFPEFQFDSKQLRSSKKIDPEFTMWFSYKKDHGGLGKMFEIHLGLSFGGYIDFSTSIFRLFGEFDKPSWVYHTKEELDLCIAESVQMLRVVLPPFETNLARYMAVQERNRPAWMSVSRPLSARQALEQGFELAGVSEDEMVLQSIISWPRILDNRMDPRPWTAEGVLNPEGCWKISAFKKSDIWRALTIELPYEGPVRFGWSQPLGWSPAITKWMDSTDAVVKIRTAARSEGEPLGLKLVGYDPPRWVGSFPYMGILSICAHSGVRIQ